MQQERNFAGSDDKAITDGDFAMLESELQTVLKKLTLREMIFYFLRLGAVGFGGPVVLCEIQDGPQR